MERALERLSTTCYDLLIVGGGIYGACAAREAARRGLSVGLVEQGDLGHATSANSHKIAHGGLRYLQSADFARMRSSIRERAFLLRAAPHLVHPLPFLMPTFGCGLRSRSAMAAAFLINDLVSWDRNRGLADPDRRIPSCRVISTGECLRLAPWIPQRGLTGGALWYDGQVDNPERLTLAFVLSAVEAGADAANYVKVTGLLRSGQRVCGVRATDQLTGADVAIQSRMVLNAAGPWVQRVLGGRSGIPGGKPQRWLKAMNLVTRRLVDGVALGLVTRRRSDRSGWSPRLLVITPWRGRSIIGTAYASHQGEPEQARATETEIEGFLDDINAAYPAARLTRQDVRFVHLGLLPATRSDTSGVRVPPLEQHARILDHRRLHGVDGLVSVVGVKLTTARHVAERAMDMVCAKLGHQASPASRVEEPLPGGRIPRFSEWLSQAIDERPWGLSVQAVRHLVCNYGSSFRQVLRWLEADRAYGQAIEGSAEVIKAEVIHAVRCEMALRLGDVVFRRTDLGTRGHPGERCLEACAGVMARECGWDARRTAQELDEVRAVFRRYRLAPPEPAYGPTDPTVQASARWLRATEAVS